MFRNITNPDGKSESIIEFVQRFVKDLRMHKKQEDLILGMFEYNNKSVLGGIIYGRHDLPLRTLPTPSLLIIEENIIRMIENSYHHDDLRSETIQRIKERREAIAVFVENNSITCYKNWLQENTRRKTHLLYSVDMEYFVVIDGTTHGVNHNLDFDLSKLYNGTEVCGYVDLITNTFHITDVEPCQRFKSIYTNSPLIPNRFAFTSWADNGYLFIIYRDADVNQIRLVKEIPDTEPMDYPIMLNIDEARFQYIDTVNWRVAIDAHVTDEMVTFFKRVINYYKLEESCHVAPYKFGSAFNDMIMRLILEAKPF